MVIIGFKKTQLQKMDNLTPNPVTKESSMSGIFKSRKFWASIAGVLSVVLGPVVGIDGNAIEMIVMTVVGYVVGTALEDAGSKISATKAPTKAP
jgi:hypothetical protein